MTERKRTIHPQMVRWIDRAREYDKKILEEYLLGQTMAAIGRRWGVSRQRIHQRLVRARKRMTYEGINDNRPNR